ncbi:MAG TPA: radical SAM protein [Bacteroidales bacterium]|nr:radical SAM protein [Bacteroidales bacterium]
MYGNLFKSLYLNISSPVSVSVNLTNKCNQHCIYCEIGQGCAKSKKKLLALKDLKWIIDEMNFSRIPFLDLGGGEPLLFEDIFEVIQYAYKFGIKSSILTNGMLLPDLSSDKIKILKDCESFANVSIDSFSVKNEEYIRGAKDALSRSTKGVTILVKHHIPVNIMTVISAQNYKDLFDVVVNANSLGVNRVIFQPVIFISCFPEVEPINNKNKRSLNVSLDNLIDIEDQFRRILDFERNAHIKTNVDVLAKWLTDYIRFVHSYPMNDFFFKKVVNRFWCAPLYSTIAINYYGEISPCNMLKPAGSIKDRGDKSLLQLWNDSCATTRKMINMGHYPDECRSCVCAFDNNGHCLKC